MNTIDIQIGDSNELLKQIPCESVQCCVTSPPYYALRDYGVNGQMGQEKSPEKYIWNMMRLFDEVFRVLKKDGTLWLNIGEVKPKDLIGIPWMLAFALRSRGWYLRGDIIWAKANCMPESVTDRPTRSHEFLFLLTKGPKYYYDHEAIKEPCIWDVDGTGTAARKARQKDDNKSVPTAERNGMRNGGFKDASKMGGKHGEKQRGHSRKHAGFNARWDAMSQKEQCTGMRNKRDVWTIAPANYSDAHFATFPPDLVKPCILAGTKAGDMVLDPFGGSGTTGAVALELGRSAILLEINPLYAEMASERCKVTYGLPL